ncbi:MAG: hypothetical protein WCP52_05095 [Bacteroidota bacterium]
MRRIHILCLCFLFFLLDLAHAGTIVLEGKYQNENLYVLNGPTDNGVGFCTYQVSINGRISTDEVNSSSFAIDFSQFDIKPGTYVIVKIDHKDDCSPRVINPQVLQPHATFEVLDINIDKNEILNWTTKNEMGSLPFVIEQFRWHKWIKVGEVKGIGEIGKNTYFFKITPHSGENKFRVRQVGYGEKSKKSTAISYVSSVAIPTYIISKDQKNILFSDETMYQVYDAYGAIVKQGYGKNLAIANLKKGIYYICYDNLVVDFKKKK